MIVHSHNFHLYFTTKTLGLEQCQTGQWNLHWVMKSRMQGSPKLQPGRGFKSQLLFIKTLSTHTSVNGYPIFFNPSWASAAENGLISPQWHHTTCGQRGGRPKSNHGQTTADRKRKKFSSRGRWKAVRTKSGAHPNYTLACTSGLSNSYFHIVTFIPDVESVGVIYGERLFMRISVHSKKFYTQRKHKNWQLSCVSVSPVHVLIVILLSVSKTSIAEIPYGITYVRKGRDWILPIGNLHSLMRDCATLFFIFQFVDLYNESCRQGWATLLSVLRDNVPGTLYRSTLETMYFITLEPGTLYPPNHVPQAQKLGPSTLDIIVFPSEIWQKSWITSTMFKN